MSRAINKLLDDARKSGYEVSHETSGRILVRRWVKTNATGKRVVGLSIYEDGTAIRLDVDLSVAAGIRSVKTMREILGC